MTRDEVLITFAVAFALWVFALRLALEIVGENLHASLREQGRDIDDDETSWEQMR